jgi:hypothetical protein
MRTTIPLTVLATALACSLASTPAHARARVFVASYGNDSNPCTFGSPCKTLQQAVNVVDAGGEVTAIDSAGFGPINISRSVTITSPDGVEAGIVPPFDGDAIAINAGSTDAVVLRGLTLEGAGVGRNGVNFATGGSLTIMNCVMKDFLNDGIALFLQESGTATFAVTNTTVTNNRFQGLSYSSFSNSPNVRIVVDHVVATGNGVGLEFSGISGNGAADIAITNSVASNNTIGIFISGGNALTISIDNATVSGNTTTGIDADPPASVLLNHSVIQGNGTGTLDATSNTFYTYGTNLIDLNGNNFGGAALNTSKKLQ